MRVVQSQIRYLDTGKVAKIQSPIKKRSRLTKRGKAF